MAYDDQDRVTALAGIYQAVGCVMRIAHSGSADTAAMEPCIYSLFQVDADTVAAVFGPPRGAGQRGAPAHRSAHRPARAGFGADQVCGHGHPTRT